MWQRVNELLSLLNIGTCDLHVLNGAFEQATESCDWKTKEILTAAYQILQDAQVRKDV